MVEPKDRETVRGLGDPPLPQMVETLCEAIDDEALVDYTKVQRIFEERNLEGWLFKGMVGKNIIVFERPTLEAVRHSSIFEEYRDRATTG